MNFIIDKLFILKFLKFGVVGVSGMVIDFGITYLCKEKLKIHKYLSNALGFVLAATNNWLLNRIWTFESSNPQMLAEYLKFFFVSVAGLAINTLVLWVLTDKLRVNFYLSKLVAIGVAKLWNFLANYFLVFG